MFLLFKTVPSISKLGILGLSVQNNPVLEIFSFVLDRFFKVELRTYRHINLGPDADSAAQLLIIGICIGLIIASVMMCYTRTKLGRLIRILIKNECLSPESAKTLSDLGEFRNASVRRALTRGTTLRKYVTCVEEADFDADLVKQEAAEKLKNAAWWKKAYTAVKHFFAGDDISFRPDFKTAHFYIPEDIKYRAEVRFERRGSGWLTVIIIAIVSPVFASILCKLLPDIFQLMDNIISMMSPS